MLPTGTVTFLFTDIEGSTRLLQALRDRYADVLREHHRIVRSTFEVRGGREIESQGDGFFYAFPRAHDGLVAAVLVQRALAGLPWPDGAQVRVRMGLHTGEPLVVGTGYVSIDIHRAARICAVGHGGQILLSQTTRDLVEGDLPEGVSFRDLGEHRLKDLTRPQRLFQAVAADLTADFPPLKSLNALPHNLPIQLTSLIGREAELAQIDRLLENASCRLLTLVGPGGIGKTRLALQTAAQRVERHAHGAYFVPLAPVSSPEFLVPAVADAVRFPIDTHSSNLDPTTQLLDYLAGRSVLMVIDNFEHLVEGAGLLTAMLERAHEVKLVVTSRERLNLQGEWAFDVKGMTYPKNGDGPGIEDYSALVLFVERARQVNSGFSLSAEDRRHAVRICQLVEGMPLGIELAAAWASTLSCKEIAEEIERSLDFLASSMRGRPDKHRSLRAAFDHSWRLLTEEQRAAFRRLSVFRGGFRREAAMAVADLHLPQLSDFVSKSLLRRNDLGRHEMHELLRQYAEEKLSAIPEEQDSVRERHARHYLRFLAEREKLLLGERLKGARDEIRADLANVRAGISWAVTHWEEDQARDALAGLWAFYWVQGWQEGVDAFRGIAQALQQTRASGSEPGAPDGVVLVSALVYQACFSAALDDHETSEGICRACLPILRGRGSSPELAMCLYSMGVNAVSQGRYAESRQHLEESLTTWRELQNVFMASACYLWLGWVDYQAGEYDQAGARFQESHRLSKQQGSRPLMAFALSKLGTWSDALQAYEQAKHYHEEARRIFVEFEDRAGEGYATSRMSFSAWGMGEYAEARRLGRTGLELFKSIGHRWGVATSLCRIGYAELGLGHRLDARNCFYEGLERAVEFKLAATAAYALIGIGSVLAREGQGTRAVELLAFALDHPVTPALYKDIAKRELADLEPNLPPDVVTAARERAKAWTLEQVVEAVSRDRAAISAT